VSKLGGGIGLSDGCTVGGGVDGTVFAVVDLGRRHCCGRKMGRMRIMTWERALRDFHPLAPCQMTMLTHVYSVPYWSPHLLIG
jgi:hypothetical protein